jgi:hypothetical protein
MVLRRVNGQVLATRRKSASADFLGSSGESVGVLGHFVSGALP